MKIRFWKFSIRGKGWCNKWLAWHWVPDQISGMLYCGVTICKVSFIYSDYYFSAALQGEKE